MAFEFVCRGMRDQFVKTESLQVWQPFIIAVSAFVLICFSSLRPSHQEIHKKTRGENTIMADFIAISFDLVLSYIRRP